MSSQWQNYLELASAKATRLKHSIWGYPLHNSESYRPVFIVGSGRSGNTLLRRILQGSNQIHIPPETYVLKEIIYLFHRYRTLPWKHLVHLLLAIFEFHPEFDKFEISLRPLVQQLLKTPVKAQSLAFILDSFYRFHGQEQGKNVLRWGDKTPLNAYALDEILSVFPDAQFIHLIRDGADVAHSYVMSGFQPNLERAAQRWKTSIIAVQTFAKKYPNQCYEIRYEQLVYDPEKVIQHLCNFLDLQFKASMLESLEHTQGMGDVPKMEHHAQVLQPITQQSIGKGRTALTPTEKENLQQWIGQELEQLGYDPLL